MLTRREVLRSAGAAAAMAGMAPLAACTQAGRGGVRPAAILPEPSLASIDPRLLTVRRAEERGSADLGWLDTHYTFSFAGYDDPRYRGFRRLRVINEDRIVPAGGFPTHPHREMEILTYVLSGALEHEDSLGNGGIIRPTEVQRMTAGTGIRHSEFNPSRAEAVHLLQVWIEPMNFGRSPSYDQRVFPVDAREGRLRLVASGDGRDGSIAIQTDADVRATVLEPRRSIAFANLPGRHVWLQIARGSLSANGVPLRAGDGLSTSAAGALDLEAGPDGAEALLFDLA